MFLLYLTKPILHQRLICTYKDTLTIIILNGPCIVYSTSNYRYATINRHYCSPAFDGICTIIKPQQIILYLIVGHATNLEILHSIIDIEQSSELEVLHHSKRNSAAHQSCNITTKLKVKATYDVIHFVSYCKSTLFQVKIFSIMKYSSENIFAF